MTQLAFVLGGVAIGFAIGWWWPWPVRTQTCMYFCNGTRTQITCARGTKAAAQCLADLKSQCASDEPVS